jgi:hypothetical protein
MKKLIIPALAMVAAIASTGCMDFSAGKYTPEETPAGKAKIVNDAEKFRASSPAGVTIQPPSPNPVIWAQLISSRAFSTRPDPFALEPKERNYETRQTTERLFGQNGWRVDFVPAVETVVVPVVEPQPYRRLAGVIVGDSVLALIDMGDGQLQIIRPGQEINGWRVVSIDAEKAILRRGGNKLPHEVTVRLETPPSGFPGGGGGTGNNPGGGSGGGIPGGGDPGRPATPPGGTGGGPGIG